MNIATIPPCTIVLKLGTSSIVHETTHQPLLSTLSAIVETVVDLKRLGHKVVLVSSGAIGVGLKRMDMQSRPKGLAGKQALAAIGQGRLIALWDNLFGQLGQPIAQVLLTRGDISDRTRYINAVNTFKELLNMGVVPIVNENDTVSVSEIKFGDNDTLSAITSSMIHADYLFLLTDVDGLYTSNPRKDPSARAIECVTSISAIRSQVSTNTIGSSLGTGGMETKLIAAEIAMAAGVATVICSSKHPERIFEIIEFDDGMLPGRRGRVEGEGEGGEEEGEEMDGEKEGERERDGEREEKGEESDTNQLEPPMPTPTHPSRPRPPHTLFIPTSSPTRDLKQWTAHTLNPSGTIIITSGAHMVLSKRESGGRLLAAGVVGVLGGGFAAGQAVRICVMRRVGVEEKEEERRRYEEALRSGGVTPTSGGGGFGGGSGGGSGGFGGVGMTPLVGVMTPTTTSRAESRRREEGGDDDDDNDNEGRDRDVGEADVVEVGRGLANYNSAQIMAVRGMNSSMLPRILGYADSEYVVENVTIRVSLTSLNPAH